MTFKALLAKKEGGRLSIEAVQFQEQDLMSGDVLVAVEYSTVNYKDALAVTGRAEVIRQFPLIPGIDFAGIVEASSHPGIAVGDRVVANGWGLSQTHHGGYAQKDVTELARVFTGWSISRPQEGETHFVFRRPLHDRGAKTVLGVKLPAGGGMKEGERMIRFLAVQPATAHHIAYQLAQRLVADDPPPALVDRVAKRFLATGGDLRATVKAVIDSPEFWDPQSYGKKVKSPFEYAISAIRAVGGQISDPLPLARELQKIGEPLYFAQPPTGYSDKSEAWMNAGAMMNRVNFAIALSAGKMPGVQVKPSDAALKLSSPEFQRQ